MARVKDVPMDGRKLAIVWLCILGTLILVGGVWMWYSFIHRNPYKVFWDSVATSLRTQGVTRQIKQTTGQTELDQTIQLSLGQNNVARGITTITQPSANGETKVLTEIIGTPDNNFARYTDIQTANRPDISSIQNVWSRENLVQGFGQNQSVFAETVFSSVPFANLTSAQQQELLQFMKDNKVYDVDYRGAKVVERAGKQAYEYKVNVNLKSYIEALKKIDEWMGLKQMSAVDPDQYAGLDPAQLTIVSGINSRQVLEITFGGSARTEKYFGYGAQVPVEVPDTNLMREQLELQIQKIFTPTGN